MRAFVDMDGVIVDFDGYMIEHNLTSEQVKKGVGHYLNMKPMPGAIEFVRALIENGVDVWIATKPPTGVAHAYSEKAQWIFNHLPELKNKIIITHHKGLLGSEHDFLIDDRPHQAGCEEFTGTLIHFKKETTWHEVLREVLFKDFNLFDATKEPSDFVLNEIMKDTAKAVKERREIAETKFMESIMESINDRINLS